MKIQEQLDLRSYKSSGFVRHYQKLVKDEMIPFQYDVLYDKVEGAERSNAIKNFINAAKVLRGEKVDEGFYGMVFQDSDVAKWIEAAAFSLVSFPDSELESKIDEVIEIVAAAQDEDGYLDTAFTIEHKERRFEDLLEGHEMYCAGHMIEAACAYYEATGKRRLMDVMLKTAKLLYDRFVTAKTEGFPGHPEIELALLRLYRLSGEKFCYDLAEHFLTVRGTDPGYYRREVERRTWSVWNSDGIDQDYQQSSCPIKDESEAKGHAVRAMYLYTAAADLMGLSGDQELKKACERIWDDITSRKLYITGGIGATSVGESFSKAYDLPNDTAYNETCASIALMFYASRLLEENPDSGYSDVMEQAFYNTVLSGTALDGKSFYYVNTLESDEGISGTVPIQRHALITRPKWFACACCPPNLARLVMSLGKYAYGDSDDTAYCHLYASGDVTFRNGVKLTCETDYPFGFEIKYKFISGGKTAIRLPSWSTKTILTKDGEVICDKQCSGVSPACSIKNGYAYIDAKDGDEFVLLLDDSPRLIFADNVPALSGKVAMARGPLVYCFENVDNKDLIPCAIDCTNLPEIGEDVTGLPMNVPYLIASGRRIVYGGDGNGDGDCSSANGGGSKKLYHSGKPVFEDIKLKAIPYFCRENRGETTMRVWMPYY